MAPQSFDAAVEKARATLESFINGDPGPGTDLWSRGDDIVLNNPFGPPVVGFARVQAERARAAAMFAGGEAPTIDEVARWSSVDAGYVVTIERGQVKRAGGEELVPIAVRVTTVFRREDDGWRMCVRHADNVTVAVSRTNAEPAR